MIAFNSKTEMNAKISNYVLPIFIYLINDLFKTSIESTYLCDEISKQQTWSNEPLSKVTIIDCSNQTLGLVNSMKN